MKALLKKLISQILINRLWHMPKAILAAFVYGFPGKKLTVIAVAGTKGKTSTAYYISALLDALGARNALISTAALKITGKETLNQLKLTTPTPFFLQSFLATALKSGCTYAVLEVSSHALLQYRAWGVPFSYVSITNLTPDHLEIHATAAEYQKIHKRLISPFLKALILNADDPNLRIFDSSAVPTVRWSASSPLAERIRRNKLRLLGLFNVANVAAAVTTLRCLDFSENELLAHVAELHAAPGRMEAIQDEPFRVIVDYAHSTESLSAFFQAITPLGRGRIITVFGACGDRDRAQRPIMGDVIDNASDAIIVTNDDPYSEPPDRVAGELIAGITRKKLDESYWKILDRAEAIQKALLLARPGDCVCILGKGAEQWQIFKNNKVPWDDRRVVREKLRILNSSY